MRARYTEWHWYDLVLGSLALAIIYPDKILDWLSEVTGWFWNGWHLIAFELATIGVTAPITFQLMQHNPKLKWWEPLLYVAIFGLFRSLHRSLEKFFNFDD